MLSAISMCCGTRRERETLNKLPGCTVLSEYTYIQYVHEGPGSGVMGAALFSGVYNGFSVESNEWGPYANLRDTDKLHRNLSRTLQMDTMPCTARNHECY